VSTELLAEGGGGVVGVEGETAVAGEIAARSPLELFTRRLRRDKVALVAAGFVVFLIVLAIFAPLIVDALGAPKPDVQDRTALDKFFGTPTGPSSSHYFGVDELGQDVFSRTIYGLRLSLVVAVVATAISLIIGVLIGLLAGFYRGIIDTILSRFIDIVLAFPVLLLGIGISSSCSLGKNNEGCLGGLIKPGATTVIFVIALVNWTYIARIVRGQVLSLREKEFVEAARSLGASDMRIVFRHILPNLVAPLIVYTSLLIPQNILFEAALSFLGVGVQPPTPSLGKMISDAAANFDTQWWAMLFPGTALVLIVLAFNLVGDGLQDALNPRSSD
jgi:ABC-type dipeptide/oligopeptide/nickel transport system permease subunit